MDADLPINKVVQGDCAEVMQGWPMESIDLVVTSPPYWGLRDYGAETVRVWGGLPECEHEWRGQASSFNKQGGEGKQSTNLGTLRGEDQKSDFCSECGAWRGSLGLEPHPPLFIDHLVEVCREIKRVLKPSGTFWLNLGDTYYGSHTGKIPQAKNPKVKIPEPPSSKARGNWLQPKQKLMIPSRVAIALQEDGWILRSDIIWHKPNHMPSSVKDRLTTSYEHVFLFAKARRYYFDLDEIRVPHSASTIQRITQPNVMNQKGGDKQRELRGEGGGYASRSADMVKSIARNYGVSGSKYLEQEHPHSIRIQGGHTGDYTHRKGKNPGDVWDIDETDDPIISDTRKELHGPTYRRHTMKIEGGQAIGFHPRGKNPGDLWRIPTTPFKGAHFATFPPKLVEPIIKAGSPARICSKCGKPRTRITEPTPEYAEALGKSVHNHKDDLQRGMRYDKVLNAEYVTKGWTDCGCGEGWTPGVVLDPFGGSGTVGRVARKLGRRFILIEINPEYAQMAEQRVRGRFKARAPGATTLTE